MVNATRKFRGTRAPVLSGLVVLRTRLYLNKLIAELLSASLYFGLFGYLHFRVQKYFVYSLVFSANLEFRLGFT